VITADIIVDLQYGDSAKGKVAHHLCRTKKYTHVLRYNGGNNAGHTIYHRGKKFVTHQVPAGVFYGRRSIIGPGCVVDPTELIKEIRRLRADGIATAGKVFVATNAHVILPAHRREESTEAAIGTTRRGIGPAYRDKYARLGKRAADIPALRPYLIDVYKEFHNQKKIAILAEGAQGFGLDIDWGDYPFVTSSHCTVAGALLNGIPAQAVRQVWGVAKIYETYVGNKRFEPRDPIFEKIRRAGDEYGATTGRPRQCNWLNLTSLERAIRINGVTHIVFSKMDVLRQVKRWVAIDGRQTMRFPTEQAMQAYIVQRLTKLGLKKKTIFFSDHKDRI